MAHRLGEGCERRTRDNRQMYSKSPDMISCVTAVLASNECSRTRIETLHWCTFDKRNPRVRRFKMATAEVSPCSNSTFPPPGRTTYSSRLFAELQDLQLNGDTEPSERMRPMWKGRQVRLH